MIGLRSSMNFADQISQMKSQQYRMKALKAFEEIGLPSRKNENWKYTSISKPFSSDLKSTLLVGSSLNHDDFLKISKHLTDQMTNLVFVNGVFEKTLSSDLSEYPEISIAEIQESALSHRPATDGIEAIHHMFFGQGLVLSISDNVSLEKPIRLVWITKAESEKLLSCPEIQIKVGKFSKVSILESYIGIESGNYIVHSNMTLTTGDSSNVIYIRDEQDLSGSVNLGQTEIIQGKDSSVLSLSLTTGSDLSRHELVAQLTQANANINCLGIYAGKGSQHLDHNTLISHEVGGCTSHQLYKGILDDKARGVFNGKVFIQKDAQKATSDQLNKTLLLSNEAEIDSQPVLMIYADDVKATHGSTIGQLSADELFYLQSRGISHDVAAGLLKKGFLLDVANFVEHAPLKQFLFNRLSKVV